MKKYMVVFSFLLILAFSALGFAPFSTAEMESLGLCAEFLFPPPEIWTACEFQPIIARIACCDTNPSIRDSIYIPSGAETTEYFDSTTMDWESVFEKDPTPWGTYWVHLDTDIVTWIWSEERASTFHSDWFRVLIESDCSVIDTAYIRIQVDNKGTIYANGTYVDTTHGNTGGGSTGWRTLHEFDLTPHFSGGVDTLEILGWNAGGIAGLLFEIVVICRGGCCGNIDPATIELQVDDHVFTTSHAFLSWDDESLLTFTPAPPHGYRDGQFVYAELISAADSCEFYFDNDFFDVSLGFFVDLSPPVFGLIYPTEIVFEEMTDSFVIYIYDSLSGLDLSSIEIDVGSGWFAIGEFGTIWADDCVIIYPDEVGLEWQPGDSIHISVRAYDSPDLCEPNSDSASYSWYMRDPNAPIPRFVHPEPMIYSACIPESIVVEIYDEYGVDGSTIELIVNGLLYDIYTPEISWDEPYLVFFAGHGWPYTDTVHVELRQAFDFFGNDISSPISLSFIVDYEDPTANFIHPEEPMVRNVEQDIIIAFDDRLSGVDPSSIVLTVDSRDYFASQLNIQMDGNGGRVHFRPREHGQRFINGDTIVVCISLTDSPDRCAANTFDECWSFLIEPAMTCGVSPNPFTPNDDGVNDRALFYYPKLYSEEVEIIIFNRNHEEVWRSRAPRQLEVLTVDGRIWDGRDTRNNMCPPGIYFYIIVQKGEIICNGTLTLVR